MNRPGNQQPLPKTAKKVFSGVIYDVYQWQQEQFDGSYKLFEKSKRPDTVGVLPVTSEEKLILAYEEQPGALPRLSLLGGRVDTGEDITAAAHRELLEETGYTCKRLELWNAYQPVTKIDWAIFTFIAKDLTKTKEAELEIGEKIELREYSFNEFLAIVTKEEFTFPEFQFQMFKALLDPEYRKVVERKLFS